MLFGVVSELLSVALVPSVCFHTWPAGASLASTARCSCPLAQPATHQQTLRRSFAIGGVGLHSGEYALVRVLPAFAGEGRFFVSVSPGTNSHHWALEQPAVQQSLEGELGAAGCACISWHSADLGLCVEAGHGAKLVSDRGSEDLSAQLFFDFVEVMPGFGPSGRSAGCAMPRANALCSASGQQHQHSTGSPLAIAPQHGGCAARDLPPSAMVSLSVASSPTLLGCMLSHPSLQGQDTGRFSGTFADYLQQRSAHPPDTLLMDAEVELLPDEQVGGHVLLLPGTSRSRGCHLGAGRLCRQAAPFGCSPCWVSLVKNGCSHT